MYTRKNAGIFKVNEFINFQLDYPDWFSISSAATLALLELSIHFPEERKN